MTRTSAPSMSPKAAYDALHSRWNIINVHTLGITSNTGSGGGGELGFEIYVFTGVTANSRGLRRAPVYFLNDGDIPTRYLDYTKRLEWHFRMVRSGSDAQVVARFQLKQALTEGVLADVGLGVQVNNFDVLGEAYGTARQTVSLGTLTADYHWQIKIVHIPDTSVQFWVNDVLTATLTGTAVPVAVAAGTQLVLSIINGAAGGVDAYFEVGKIKFIQPR